MATSKKSATTTEEIRTDPITIGPEQDAGNVLAAWQGLYWLLGARVERWDVSPDGDGVYAVGLTFDANRIPNVDKVIHDVSFKNGKHISRQLDLATLYYVVKDNVAPAPFEDAAGCTDWMAQYTRDSSADGDTNRSPQYIKDAIAAYKREHGIESRRGRPSTTVKVNLQQFTKSLTEDDLRKVDPKDLAAFEAMLQGVIAEASTEAVAS